MKEQAIHYLNAGLSVLPANPQLKFAALPQWKQYQRRLPTETEVCAWFKNGQTGLCVVTGVVSGNLEMIDFDLQAELFEAWCLRVHQADPDKACCCPEYESWQWPSFNGYGGSLSFIGFCDYMSVGYDTWEVNYINGGSAAHCRWRFALWGGVDGVNTKRVILKDNIACDFFRYDFLGSDWDIFQGCTLIPLTPDENGFFDYTVEVPAGSTVSDFGVSNINAYNWKYRYMGDILGSVWTS